MSTCQNMLATFARAYNDIKLYENYIGKDNKFRLIAAALPGTGAIASVYLLGCSIAGVAYHTFQEIASRSLGKKDGIDHCTKAKHYAVLCGAQTINILTLGLFHSSFALYRYSIEHCQKTDSSQVVKTPPNNDTMTSLVKSLQFESVEGVSEFTYITKNQLDERTDVTILATTSTEDADRAWTGILVQKVNDHYVLHLCPGGAYSSFTKENFSHIMPIVIAELVKLGIAPVVISDKIGRHPDDTLDNFIAWQQS